MIGPSPSRTPPAGSRRSTQTSGFYPSRVGRTTSPGRTPRRSTAPCSSSSARTSRRPSDSRQFDHPKGNVMPLLSTSRVPPGFTEATAPANGITLNYVRGGAGPTLVLLHGYPQSWYMWRKVLSALAEHFTVIAPDLRGSGGSDAPTDGYGKSILAEDVHQLLVGLDLADEVSVVGHDIGTMVAYAYAAAHRDSTSRLVLIDSPLPDETLYQLPSLTPQGPGLWNFGFF